MDEVTGSTVMGRFQELVGQEILEVAHRGIKEWTSWEGTPFIWLATAESFMLTQLEKLVIDSKEEIERALTVLSQGIWVQKEE